MTLRDLLEGVSKLLNSVKYDLSLVLTASPLDWPIYLLVATIFVFFAGIAFVAFIIERYQEVIARGVLYSVLWLFIAGFIHMVLLAIGGGTSDNVWWVVSLPTILVLAVWGLALRGRSR